LNWLYLGIAIVSEVIATSALRLTGNFTHFWPSVVVALGYASAFYFLTLTLHTIPIGIAYAVWSGVGIVLITLVGWFMYQQHIDAPGMAGIGLILMGVVVINVFSKSAAH
jgi:small multidrug resistance pump